MLYKILYFRYEKDILEHQRPWDDCWVSTQSYIEYWHNISSALIELGESGWEIATPVYGLWTRCGMGEVEDEVSMELKSLILVNKSKDLAKERNRQISVLQDVLRKPRRLFAKPAFIDSLRTLLQDLQASSTCQEEELRQLSFLT